MALGRLIRRAAPLIVVGVAGAVAARRRAERQRQLTPPPPYPAPTAEAGPVIEVEPEPAPEPEPEPVPEPTPDEQPTVERTALEHAPWLEESEPEPAEGGSVTEIVDDLLAPGDAPEAIQDATVVEAEVEEEPPDDDALGEVARTALEGGPEVAIEVRDGVLILSGEVERAEAITEIERRAAEVPGIRSVSSLLHLPGTPPPAPSEHL